EPGADARPPDCERGVAAHRGPLRIGDGQRAGTGSVRVADRAGVGRSQTARTSRRPDQKLARGRRRGRDHRLGRWPGGRADRVRRCPWADCPGLAARAWTAVAGLASIPPAAVTSKTTMMVTVAGRGEGAMSGQQEQWDELERFDQLDPRD